MADLNVVSVRTPINLTEDVNKSATSVQVIFGMNYQQEVHVGSSGDTLYNVLNSALRELSISKGKYMNDDAFLQNVFVNSSLVASTDLNYGIHAGDKITIDEKKHNG